MLTQPLLIFWTFCHIRPRMLFQNEPLLSQLVNACIDFLQSRLKISVTRIHYAFRICSACARLMYETRNQLLVRFRLCGTPFVLQFFFEFCSQSTIQCQKLPVPFSFSVRVGRSIVTAALFHESLGSLVRQNRINSKDWIFLTQVLAPISLHQERILSIEFTLFKQKCAHASK